MAPSNLRHALRCVCLDNRVVWVTFPGLDVNSVIKERILPDDWQTKRSKRIFCP
jgi:hypothetical protein